MTFYCTVPDLEKAVGAIMTLDLDTSQGVETHLESLITPLETSILWLLYRKLLL